MSNVFPCTICFQTVFTADVCTVSFPRLLVGVSLFVVNLIQPLIGPILECFIVYVVIEVDELGNKTNNKRLS